MKKVYEQELMYTDAVSCNCGCGKTIKDKEILSTLRDLSECLYNSLPINVYKAKIIFYITSWTRCERHNKEVGGAVNSLHMEGKAIDFVVAVEFGNDEILIPAEMTAFLLNAMAPDKNEIITYEKGRVHLGLRDLRFRLNKK